jgi:hypothetical protein
MWGAREWAVGGCRGHARKSTSSHLFVVRRAVHTQATPRPHPIHAGHNRPPPPVTKARAQQLRRLALAAELARRHGGAAWTADHDCPEAAAFVTSGMGTHCSSLFPARFCNELADAADAAQDAAGRARARATALARAEAALAAAGLDPALASERRYRGYLDAAARGRAGGRGPALLGLVKWEWRHLGIEREAGRDARRAEVHAAATAAGVADLCWESQPHPFCFPDCGICLLLNAYVDGVGGPGALDVVVRQVAEGVPQREARLAQVEAALAAEGLSRADATRLCPGPGPGPGYRRTRSAPGADRVFQAYICGNGGGFEAVADAVRQASVLLLLEREAADTRARRAALEQALAQARLPWGLMYSATAQAFFHNGPRACLECDAAAGPGGDRDEAALRPLVERLMAEERARGAACWPQAPPHDKCRCGNQPTRDCSVGCCTNCCHRAQSSLRFLSATNVSCTSH